MSDKYVAYPEYKDSGVGFLNKLPFSWGIKKVNYLFSFGRGLNITKANLEDSGVPVVNYGEVHSKFGFEINPDIHNLKRVSEDYLKTTPAALLQNGDFVFADTSEDLDGAGNFTQFVGNGLLFAGYHTVVLRPNDGNVSRYLAYAFESTECRNQIRLAVKGVKVFSITQSILKDVMLPMPPPEEQIIIAAFLDYETARIDQLIAKQQRLIELLKEKRQAVLSHAVTKGLNPDAPMKDSGVEWLGQVPEHWTVSRVKYVSSVSGGFAFSSDDFVDSGIQLIKIGNLYQSRLQLERDPTFLPIGFSKSHAVFKVSKGDLLMSLTGTLGKRDYGFAVRYDADEDSLLNQRVAKFNLNQSKINPDFMLLLLLSDSYLSQIYSMPSGTKQANLSNSDVLSPLICYPSQLNEQESIVKHVYDSVSKIDLLTSKTIQVIDFMNERRYSLISAAVTGKIDLRNWERPNA
ncbi:restriction endonuclease subunit S [Shewanella sp. SM21]|uniref:restriction endonuclease subunit S n=1 Tax=Shewanella sp. SM21 TaxID=2912793 RepID=UPI0021DAFB53|nr:restriction endonuclease subunit S [Shewanella sp. SM21]MCU8086288.1 restriction endonuclease subunit S [Shewanella sp. SM21]